MKEYYEIDIAGLKRQLPLCPLNESLYIGAFVIFGDVELTVHCAAELNKLLPEEYDYLITAESKGIPLIHEMTRQSGRNKYMLARKAAKLYMKDVVSTEVKSITTAKKQILCIDGADAALMKGKKIVLVDDVISTGESLEALEKLVSEVGGEVVGRLAILAEGDAGDREDIRYLQYLPLFNAEGDPI